MYKGVSHPLHPHTQVKLRFQAIKHIVTKIDCQPTAENGVIVLVTGRLKVSQPAHTYLCEHQHTHTYMNIHTYLYAHTHTYMHTHTYLNEHAHTLALLNRIRYTRAHSHAHTPK